MKHPNPFRITLSRDEASFKSPAWHATALAQAEAQPKSGHAKFVDLETAKKQLAKRRR
jgi:hypothetical protein